MAQSSIIKSNLIFGGAQLVQMLTIVLRAKLIAVMLGSAGMGLNAILQSVLHIVNNICACGIMQSSVREISQACADDQKNALCAKVHIFRRLLTLSALTGLAICILGALPLSQMSLGNTSYIASFVVLGFGTMFFTLMQGETSILQGTHQVKALALSSIIGSLLSLAVCIPCYYFFALKGVALSIAIANFVYWLIYLHFTRKLKFGKSAFSLRQAFVEGKPMIKLGFVLMLGSFLVTLFTYLTNVSIRLLGTINDVGLYQGAAAIATQSILVVTSVLAADFFPRLSGMANQLDARNKLVNEQFNLVVLAISSIACTVISLAPLVINLLLAPDFMVAAPMLKLMAAALLFRGTWIVMSYVILSQGDRRVYFIYDGLLGNGLNYLIGIIAYYWGGLTGIGIANVVSSVLVAGLLFTVSKRKYSITLSRPSCLTFLTAIALVVITYAVSTIWGYASIAILLAAMGWSFSRLNKSYGIVAKVKALLIK